MNTVEACGTLPESRELESYEVNNQDLKLILHGQKPEKEFLRIDVRQMLKFMVFDVDIFGFVTGPVIIVNSIVLGLELNASMGEDDGDNNVYQTIEIVTSFIRYIEC